MNPIKYRAWEIDWEGGKGRMLCWADIRLWSMIFFGKTSQYIFMLWTGFTDDEGTEIYEGDIVELKEFRAEVIWADAGFTFKALPNDDWLDDWNFADDASRTRVIGNIYENQDLMV